MPLLSIETNADCPAGGRRALIIGASQRVAAMLGKPEGYVMVSLRCNPDMCFAGSDAPLAYLELKSLGLPESDSVRLSASLCALVSEHLGVAGERIYIEFSSPPRHLWGWDSATF